MITVAGTFIGVILVYALLPYFNIIIGRQLEFQVTYLTFPTYLLFGLILGIIAGLYPSILLSRIKIPQILKTKSASNKASVLLRNGLIIFQFTVAIVLVNCFLIVGNQLQYLQDKWLGFDRHNVIILKRVFALSNQKTFQDEVMKLAGVVNVGATSDLPGDGRFVGA